MRRFLSALLLCGTFSLPALADDRADLVAGGNAFAVDLYAQLKKEPGNIFLSPESISTALAMTYAGARGPTADEMAKALHFTLPQEKLHPAMGQLIHDLNTGGAAHGYSFKVANALWLQKDFHFQPDFLKLTKDNYEAGANGVDFKNATEDARLAINAWVEDRTEHKIKDLIKQGLMDKSQRLVLTNAIYFKGDWANQFDKNQTRDEAFAGTKAAGGKVPFMHRTAGYDYLENDTLRAISLPYKNDDLSMVVFLPKEKDGLPALENSLTAEKVATWIAQLQTTEDVELSLPKFKSSSTFDALEENLKALGMKLAFTGAADFTGMADPKDNPDEPLLIAKVVHKAFVEVDETGTEAAAATAVMMMAGSAMREPAPKPVFRADHPFIYLIRDNKSGSILFIGRIEDPAPE